MSAVRCRHARSLPTFHFHYWSPTSPDLPSCKSASSSAPCCSTASRAHRHRRPVGLPPLPRSHLRYLVTAGHAIGQRLTALPPTGPGAAHIIAIADLLFQRAAAAVHAIDVVHLVRESQCRVILQHHIISAAFTHYLARLTTRVARVSKGRQHGSRCGSVHQVCYPVSPVILPLGHH